MSGRTPGQPPDRPVRMDNPLRDRRVLAAGVGVAVVLALIVRARAGGQTPATATAGQAGVLGTLDTSSQDAYNNFENTLSQFQGQITDIQTQLAGLQQSTPTPPPAQPPPDGLRPVAHHPLTVAARIPTREPA